MHAKWFLVLLAAHVRYLTRESQEGRRQDAVAEIAMLVIKCSICSHCRTVWAFVLHLIKRSIWSYPALRDFANFGLKNHNPSRLNMERLKPGRFWRETWVDWLDGSANFTHGDWAGHFGVLERCAGLRWFATASVGYDFAVLGHCA